MKDYFETNFDVNDEGELVLRGSYNIAKELADQITSQKETLWKRFCQDVCEKIASHYSDSGIDVINFHKVFNEKFNETMIEWEINK